MTLLKKDGYICHSSLNDTIHEQVISFKYSIFPHYFSICQSFTIFLSFVRGLLTIFLQFTQNKTPMQTFFFYCCSETKFFIDLRPVDLFKTRRALLDSVFGPMEYLN